MKNNSPSLDYCLKLLRRGPYTFTQFINILIETKQNDITYPIEDYPELQLILSFL